MNTHVAPDDLSFLARYREIRSRFAPKPSIPMRVVEATETVAPSPPPPPEPEPAVVGPVTIDHPVIGNTLRAVARVADMSIGTMIFADDGLSVAARQVAIVYLTEGVGLPAEEVEAVLGMVPGTAKRALAALAPLLQRKALSFTMGPEAVARSILSDDVARPSRVRVADCRRIAAEVGGVTIDALRSSRRDMRVVRVRQVAMWMAKAFTLSSLPEIGRQFGNRDHTTVLHAVRKLDPVADRLRSEIPPGAPLELWAKALLEDDWRDASRGNRR